MPGDLWPEGAAARQLLQVGNRTNFANQPVLDQVKNTGAKMWATGGACIIPFC